MLSTICGSHPSLFSNRSRFMLIALIVSPDGALKVQPATAPWGVWVFSSRTSAAASPEVSELAPVISLIPQCAGVSSWVGSLLNGCRGVVDQRRSPCTSAHLICPRGRGPGDDRARCEPHRDGQQRASHRTMRLRPPVCLPCTARVTINSGSLVAPDRNLATTRSHLFTCSVLVLCPS